MPAGLRLFQPILAMPGERKDGTSMPKAAPAAAPARGITTVTYIDGTVAQYETATPRMIYDANRLGVMSDDMDAGFFMLWLAAGRPGLAGALTIDTARPALEAWLDTVKAVDAEDTEQAGPPTKRLAPSRGSAA